MREHLEALIAGWKNRASEQQTVRAITLRGCADDLQALLTADAGEWLPASDLPETLPHDSQVVLWSAEHVITGQSPYPGGGWARLFTVSEVWWPLSRHTFIKAGITHFRFPEAPPQEPPR